jgi:hypothetical protein
LSISYTQMKQLVKDRELSKEVVKVAEYVFRTHYGAFPRAGDESKFLPIVHVTLEEWKVFYKTELEVLRQKFFHDTVSRVIDHVKAKGGHVESV